MLYSLPGTTISWVWNTSRFESHGIRVGVSDFGVVFFYALLGGTNLDQKQILFTVGATVVGTLRVFAKHAEHGD